MLTVLDLCSGIGGFALGLERAGGFRTAAFCEANVFCREVLQSHWPDVPVFHDLRKLRGWHVGYVDCITAGFPCQPHSLAGKQEGPADPRDLWPDVFRVVREIMPEWFIGENVPGLDGKHMALDRVLIDLESASYSAITIEIPACAVDAPHIRKRLFIVANRNGEQHDRRGHVGPRGRSKPANGGSHVANCASLGPQVGKEQRHAQFPAPRRGGHMGNGALVRRTEGRPEHARQQGRSAIAEPSVSSRDMDNGGWAGAEWLDCPDGKRRRVGTGVRRMVDGFSERMVRSDNHRRADESTKRAAQTSGRSEILHEVWRSVLSEPAAFESLGRQNGVCQAEILLAFMCQLTWGSDDGRSSCPSYQAAWAAMRGVRLAVQTSSASRERRHHEQHPGEHSNPVRALSWILAQYARAEWDAYCGPNAPAIPLLVRDEPKRVDQIRAYGNAVLPQIVERIAQAVTASHEG